MLTKTEVAALLGIDRSRVYQIEKRALAKMRKALIKNPLRFEEATASLALRDARTEFESAVWDALRSEEIERQCQ